MRTQTEYEKEILQTINELTDDERLDAKEAARGVILREIGDKPTREQFAGVTVSEFPRWVRGLVGLLMAVVFVAAAMPSLFRLYSAGRTYHLTGIPSEWQASVVGVSTFLLAEFIIITSTLAASIFFHLRWQRALFALPISMGLAVAFVGNWTVVQPHDLFSWLETVVPPLTVVFVSFIGERLILDAMKQAHADEREYQQAYKDWYDASRAVEHHPKWQVVYGRALLAALRDSNARGTGAKARKEYMATMSRRAWSVVVRREFAIEAGEWLMQDESPDNSELSPVVANGGQEPAQRPFGSIQVTRVDPASMPAMQSANGHTANGASH